MADPMLKLRRLYFDRGYTESVKATLEHLKDCYSGRQGGGGIPGIGDELNEQMMEEIIFQQPQPQRGRQQQYKVYPNNEMNTTPITKLLLHKVSDLLRTFRYYHR